MHEVRPPLLGDREEGGVAWLMLIEVVHHDTDKQLETEVHAHKDKQVQVDFQVLQVERSRSCDMQATMQSVTSSSNVI